MRQQEKVKKTVIKSEERFENGFIYRYYLNQIQNSRVASYKIPLYSIGVEMINPDGEKTSAETKDIFADIGKAFSFFEKLVRNLVTPINLPYIVEDEILC